MPKKESKVPAKSTPLQTLPPDSDFNYEAAAANAMCVAEAETADFESFRQGQEKGDALLRYAHLHGSIPSNAEPKAREKKEPTGNDKLRMTQSKTQDTVTSLFNQTQATLPADTNVTALDKVSEQFDKWTTGFNKSNVTSTLTSTQTEPTSKKATATKQSRRSIFACCFGCCSCCQPQDDQTPSPNQPLLRTKPL